MHRVSDQNALLNRGRYPNPGPWRHTRWDALFGGGQDPAAVTSYSSGCASKLGAEPEPVTSHALGPASGKMCVFGIPAECCSSECRRFSGNNFGHIFRTTSKGISEFTGLFVETIIVASTKLLNNSIFALFRERTNPHKPRQIKITFCLWSIIPALHILFPPQMLNHRPFTIKSSLNLFF